MVDKKKQSDINFSLLKNPSHSSNARDLLDQIKSLTREVRANFDASIENIWFPKADICAYYITNDGKLVAYTLGGWLEKNKVAIIYSTVVKEEYQNRKLSNTLNSIIIKQMFLANCLRSFYCVARTANPVVLAGMSKYMSAYPSPYRARPTKRELEIATNVANMLSPDKAFDPQVFVIRGAFLCEGKLPKEFENIPHYSDTVNSFCQKHLRYDKKEGDAFVVVGRVSALRFVKFFAYRLFRFLFPKKRHEKDEAQFWSKYFKVYDTLNSSSVYRKLLQDVVASTSIKGSQSLLDLGCGTANLFFAIANLGIRYTGIDSCSAALDIARRKVSGKENAEIVQADIRTFSFENDTFDAVVSSNVLYTLTEADIVKVLEGAHRALKKDGAFVATGIVKHFKPHAVYWQSIKNEYKENGFFRTCSAFVRTFISGIRLLYYNKVYIKNRYDHYTFFDEALLQKLFNSTLFSLVEIKKVYADQALLVVARKR